MCGIVGYISKDELIERSLFERMTDTLAHRGPDDRGTFYEDYMALGQRRLSIIDLSEKGHQPMPYMNKYVIVLNGEIYNYIELREELASEGYSFNSKTDTEVVVAAYDKWGKDCTNRFNGMWAFAIYDREKKELFCSRDRFGVKPFYYLYNENKFIFASEIKAILPALNNKPEANIPRILDNILYGVFDHTTETLFKDIYQIRPGFSLVLNHELKISHYQYYDIFMINKNTNSYNDNVRIFKQLFIDSIKLRLRSDVPVGSCLSGGLDSSSIVCITSILLRQNVETRHDTISSCYREEDELIYDEQEYIDEVVKAAHTNSHKIYPDVKHFFKNLDKIIYYQDEPVGAVSHEPQYNVFKNAKKLGLTVMLDGQGADEQLAGYTISHSIIIREYLKHIKIIKAVREFIGFKNNRRHTEVYGLRGLLWFMIKDILPENVKRVILKGTTSREEFEWIKTSYNSREVKKTIRYASLDDYTKKSMKYGLVQLLHYEDRNSMAFSIEGRLPFLDYRLVEHVLSLPPNQKLKDGITKRILRDSMKGILPERIRNRTSKLGFAVPSDLWIMKYPEMVRQELEISLWYLNDIIDCKKVLDWYDNNTKNKTALTNPTIWRIISTGKWIKQFDISIN